MIAFACSCLLSDMSPVVHAAAEWCYMLRGAKVLGGHRQHVELWFRGTVASAA